MTVRVSLYVTVGLCLLAVPFFQHPASAQDFPYQVPRAPEFDAKGNLIGPSHSAEPPSGGGQTRTVRASSAEQPEKSAAPARTRRASAPAGTPVHAPRGPIMATPTGGPTPAPAPIAAAPPGPRLQGNRDCSQFPMMIAQVVASNRPEEELKAVALQFRDCLIMGGMDQQRAVQQVITSIENAKLGRQ